MNEILAILFDVGFKFGVFIFFVFQGIKAGYKKFYGEEKYLTPEQAKHMVDDAQINLAKSFGAQEDNLKERIQLLENALSEVKTQSVEKDKQIANLQKDVKALTQKANDQNAQIVDLFNRLEEKETALKAVSQDLKKALEAKMDVDRLYYGEKQAKEAVLETITALKGVVSAFQIVPVTAESKSANNDGPAQKDLSETLIDEKSQIE